MITKRRLAGKARTLSNAEVRLLREWKPLNQLCREIGISVSQGSAVRRGYNHKQPSP